MILLRRFPRVLAINLLLLGVGVAALEAGFGQWFSGSGFSGVRVGRNEHQVFDVSNYYPGGGRVDYRRDRFGLRGSYGRPSDIRLLVLGGSTTNELFVTEGQTWTDVLAENFRLGGAAVAVANAGIDGQSTIGHLRSIDEWLSRIPGLRPSHVLAYIGINDIHVEEQASYDDLTQRRLRKRLENYVKDNSAMYQAYLTIKRTFAARRAAIVHQQVDWASAQWSNVARPDPLPPPEPQEQERLAAYRERVIALIDSIRRFGAEAVIITQHRGTYRLSGKRLLVSLNLGDGLSDYIRQTRFNEVAMLACAERGALCVDLGAEIEFEPGDFYDYVHTTPDGSRRVAAFVYEKLKYLIR